MTIRVHLVSDDVNFDDVEFLIADENVVLGRSVRSDVQVHHALISRLHCEWCWSGEELRIRDLGSTNGTILNGEEVLDSAVQTGDRLLLGDASFIVDYAPVIPDAADLHPPVLGNRSESEMPTTRMTSSVIAEAASDELSFDNSLSR